jgi:copper(I)-binding protein
MYYTPTKLAISIGTVLITGIALTGCASGSHENPVTFTDPWIKATDTQMTALFAEVSNTGTADVSIIGAETDVASMVEVHEVVDNIMRQKSGGVVIPGNGQTVLMPGGDHIMLMGLNSELVAGDVLTVTINLSDGSTVSVDAEIRAFAGAEEDYDPGHGQMDADTGNNHDGTVEH